MTMSSDEKKRLALVVFFFAALFGLSQLRSSLSLSSSSTIRRYDVAGDGGAPPPRLAWLMSFPNSGTSYTLALVRRVSNTTMATNYGSEHLDDEGNSLFVHRGVYPHGPFRTSPRYALPERYVLTKTHCLGYCVMCHPDAYAVDQRTFENGCRTGKMYSNHGMDESAVHEVRYDVDAVDRAVHLLRNPFDNVVSRFHLAHNKRRKTGNPKHDEWLYEHTNDVTGFRKWCRELDEKYRRGEDKVFSEDVLKAFRKVPCRSEFYRYVHWHNNAIATIDRLNLTSRTVYYEDYGTKYKKTLGILMNFLELDYVGHNMKFHESNYTEYYTEDERKRVAKLLNQLATKPTYKKLSRYLDQYLPLSLLINDANP